VPLSRNARLPYEGCKLNLRVEIIVDIEILIKQSDHASEAQLLLFTFWLPLKPAGKPRKSPVAESQLSGPAAAVI